MKIDHIVLNRQTVDRKGGKEGFFLSARPGAVVRAEVLKLLSPHRAILLLGGRKVEAETWLPLKEGSIVLLRVEQAGPEGVLKVLEMQFGRKGSMTDCVKSFKAMEVPFKQLAELLRAVDASKNGPEGGALPRNLIRMTALLKGISLEEGKPPNPRFLTGSLETSGMLWERKLLALLLSGGASRSLAATMVRQDLKGLAMASVRDGEATGLVSPDGLTSFVDTLEQLQLLNALGLQEKGKMLLFIPMRWGDGYSVAQLLVDLSEGRKGNKKEGKKGTARLTLFLDMPQLGPIRADAAVCENVVRVGFLASTDAVRSLLEQHAGWLIGKLERHGFSVPQVTCRLHRGPALAETSLVDAFVDAGDHEISVII